MKRTITCLAILASATSAYAGPKDEVKKEDRKPAAADGKKYVGCRPSYELYQGEQAYRNNCVVSPTTVNTRRGFGSYPETSCAVDHDLVVSAHPVVGSCLPPGAIEL